MSIFKRQLKYYLEERNVSAAELARRTGVPKQSISDWLAGTNPRKLEQVRKVAEFLNVNLAELVFDVQSCARCASMDGAQPSSPERAGSEDRKRFELLREGSNFFFAHSAELLQIVDLADGCPIEISPSWQSTLGWTPEEIKQRHWLEWIHPDDRAHTKAVLDQQLLSRDGSLACQHRILHKSGRYFYFRSMMKVDLRRSFLFSASNPLQVRGA